MSGLTAIIVDDEAHQQEYLTALLQRFADEVTLAAICSNAEEALKAIACHQPDLVFLDVEMPGTSGFELLGQLDVIPFEVVFTTAYSKYALDAFRVAAVDFLLKPVDPALLAATLTRVKERIATRKTSAGEAMLRNLLTNLQTTDITRQNIALPVSSGLVMVRLADIIRCQVQGNYTVFFMADGSQHVVSRTITECETTLQPPHFVRIHQSHLVNTGFIRKYLKGDGGEVELDGGLRLPVSRRLKDELVRLIPRL
jgi:two-component system LytT family response regulator